MEMENKYFRIEKIDLHSGDLKGIDLGGGHTMDDVKKICRGYAPKNVYHLWERKGSRYIYRVRPDRKE